MYIVYIIGKSIFWTVIKDTILLAQKRHRNDGTGISRINPSQKLTWFGCVIKANKETTKNLKNDK